MPLLVFALNQPAALPMASVQTTAVAVTSSRPAPALGPFPTSEYIETVNRFARGPGLGLQFGNWGKGGHLGLRTDIPFGWHYGQYCGLRLGANAVLPLHETNRADPVVFGAAELFGRSPVIYGLVRFYGGGGLHFGGSPKPVHGGRTFGFSGGGHAGIEFFAAPYWSFTLEIGGQSGLHPSKYDAGFQVNSGMVFYFHRT